MAHNQLEEMITSSNSEAEYSKKLKQWAEDHLGVKKGSEIVKGSKALPQYFENSEGTKEKPKKCQV